MEEGIPQEPATADNPEPARRRLEQLFRGKGHQQEIASYSQMGDFYDQDMIALGFEGYEKAATKVNEALPQKTAKILDLGCGTGLLGKKLMSIGYDNIYGIDATPDFIKVALQKNAYRRLDVVDLDGSTTTPYDDGFFDGVVGIGVFGPDSIDQRAFPEINRIIRPGGFLIGYIRKSRLEMESEQFNIKAVLESNVAAGLWKRFPDELTAHFYRCDVGCSGESGVVVTVQKSVGASIPRE